MILIIKPREFQFQYDAPFVRFTQKDDFKRQAAKEKVTKHIISTYFNEKKQKF